MITLNIQLFGALRAHNNGQPVQIQLPAGSGLADVRAALCATIPPQQHGLIAESAIATAQAIIREPHHFTQSETLAILPPVCGG